MTTMKTVAAFETEDDVERTIDALVEAGIDPLGIEVAVSLEIPPSDSMPLQAPGAEPPASDGDGISLVVTAPQEDTTLVEDILKDTGSIDLAASDTPALGWAGDPEGEFLDKSRTPALGWAGKVSRPD